MIERLSETTALKLTASEGSKEMDLSVLQASIDIEADAMEAYLRGSYSLPVVEDGSILKNINLNLAVKNLYLNRARGAMPEMVQRLAEESESRLRAIQAGRMVLQIAGADQNSMEHKPVRIGLSSPASVFDDYYDKMP
jgi:phage gp36-like protein